MKNDKKEKAKPSKRKAKPTKAGETTKQPKPSREKPKPKANEKDEQPKPSKKKPRPTKANEKDEQPKKTKANEKDEQPKKTKADENDEHAEQPKKTKADENDDVTWSNLHEKGMLKGELSSAPYVDEGGDVVVRFQSGRVWRVPHLVPGDIDKSKGEQAALPRLGEVAESEVKKKKPRTEAKPRPVSDFILGSVRVKYASQGSKHPILKMECKGGPLRSHRRTVEAEDAVRLERRCGTGNGSGI